jgi:hypothetical protein
VLLIACANSVPAVSTGRAADVGRNGSRFSRADLSITLEVLRRGHLPAREQVRIVVVDIGLPRPIRPASLTDAAAAEAPAVPGRHHKGIMAGGRRW